MRWIVPASALLVALGCATAVAVRGGGADPDYDFKRLKTYAWMPRESTGDPRIDEALLDGRVHEGVDEDLAKKGYRLVSEGADFAVGYRAVLGRQRSVEGQGGFEGIWTAENAPRGTDTGNVKVDKVTYEGTLVLRIFDGKGKQLVWEAAADTEIDSSKSPLRASNEDKVRVAIRKMLERFPP